MKYDPDKHHRRSIRLKGYDYSQAGAYFVTICTQGRACLFGDVVDGKMQLNDAGRMVQAIWDDIPKHYLGIDIDVFQIMPNHIHGIIIVGAGPRACPDTEQPAATQPTATQPTATQPATTQPATGQPHTGQPRGVAPTLALSDVVHRFKTLTTKRYADGVKQSGWPRFDGRLWQRNYYEHIIRNEKSLNRIREYIVNNPLQWEYDRENPNMGAAPRANVGAGPRACPEKAPRACPEETPWRV